LLPAWAGPGGDGMQQQHPHAGQQQQHSAGMMGLGPQAYGGQYGQAQEGWVVQQLAPGPPGGSPASYAAAGWVPSGSSSQLSGGGGASGTPPPPGVRKGSKSGGAAAGPPKPRQTRCGTCKFCLNRHLKKGCEFNRVSAVGPDGAGLCCAVLGWVVGGEGAAKLRRLSATLDHSRLEPGRPGLPPPLLHHPAEAARGCPGSTAADAAGWPRWPRA
jgi:hypothetical protein